MIFEVLVVDDALMPHDDWMLVEHVEVVTLYVARSAVGDPETLAETWAACRMLERQRAALAPPPLSVGGMAS